MPPNWLTTRTHSQCICLKYQTVFVRRESEGPCWPFGASDLTDYWLTKGSPPTHLAQYWTTCNCSPTVLSIYISLVQTHFMNTQETTVKCVQKPLCCNWINLLCSALLCDMHTTVCCVSSYSVNTHMRTRHEFPHKMGANRFPTQQLQWTPCNTRAL